jgi:hypothetical protein
MDWSEVPYKLVAPGKAVCPKGHEFTVKNEQRFKHHTPYGNYISRVCKECAKEYRKERKRKLDTKRNERTTEKGVKPPREELLRMAASHNWVELGLHYGVSDVAVRKWAKAYKILPEDLEREQREAIQEGRTQDKRPPEELPPDGKDWGNPIHSASFLGIS